MADFNESVRKKNGIIEQLNHQCLLKETQFNPDNKEIPTYRRGSNQIDTIMCSDHISHHIKQAAIQPYDVICESDHRSMYIDIMLKEYIHTCITNNKTQPGRALCSNHPSNVKEYKEKLIEEMEHPRVKHLVETITKKFNNNSLTIEDLHLVNELDKIFHGIRIQSELNLKDNKHTDPWSPKLDQAYLLVQYWKTIKYQKEKTRINQQD